MNLGEVLAFESVCVGLETKEGKLGGIRATGQMKDSMQESVTVAHSFVQSFCLKKIRKRKRKFKKAHAFLQKAHIHLNLQGADCATSERV